MVTALCAIACALAPAYVIRGHLGFYPTTLLEAAVLLAVGGFAIQSLAARRMPLVRSPYLLPAALFIVAGAIAVATAPNRTAALGLYRAYLLEPIAFGWVLMNVVRTPERAFLVAAGLFTGASVAGLANAWVVLEAIANHTYDVMNTPPVVIYSTANAVALYMVPLAALAGALALHARGPARRVGATFFVVGLVVTVLSFSRGGYAAMAAVTLGLAITDRRRLALLGGAAATGIALLLVPPVRNRVLIQLQRSGGETTASRLDLWSAAIKIIENRPLFGAGLSGFQARSRTYYSLLHAHTYADFIDPHNILLNFWVETGLLGVISMGWIIGAGIVMTRRAWNTAAGAWRPYHLGALLALVAVLIHGMVDVPYFKNDLSLEFWTLLSLSTAGLAWGGAPARARTAAA